MPLRESDRPVVWTIREVTLIDLRSNERVYGASELREAGFLTELDVSRPAGATGQGTGGLP